MKDAATIATPRLRIEPFAPHHLTEQYVAWLNDAETMRFSENRFRRHTRESCRDYVASFADGPNYLWALVASEPPGHIGNMNAYVDERNGVADVGILIGERTCTGRGYATEAWLGVCDYLLRVRKLRKVTAGALAVNTAMVKVMQRLGMSDDGRRTRHHMWEGQEIDVVHGALFRDRWLSRYPDGPFAGDHARLPQPYTDEG